MKFLLFSGVAIAMLWLQLTVAPLLAVFGTKPNLVLISVVVMGVRWQEPWLFLYSAAAGLALDVFSHGLLGIYGISFFAIFFLARVIGASVYENSLLVGMLSVLGGSIAEGVVSVTLLESLASSVPWWHWVLARVLPAALVNALWSPLMFLALGRLERWVRLPEAGAWGVSR